MSKPPSPPAASRLTIDLDAIVGNWRRLNALGHGAETGAAVKADAYGLGAERIIPVLKKAGCRSFFTAYPGEGVAARNVMAEARIFVLGGLSAESAPAFVEHRLIPVLNNIAEIDLWRRVAVDARRSLACALHFDTGMNRLGVEAAEAERIFAEPERLNGIEPVLVMSHLACSDQPDHPMNADQLHRFEAIRAHFPGVPGSLANSGGVMSDRGLACDLTRPGIALYGGHALATGAGPIKPVVTFEARILQIRRANKGETVGYGATTTLNRDSVIAIAAAGYTDGYLRSASGSGVPLREACAGAKGAIGEHVVPILGRISMDLTAFDVTDMPDTVLEKVEWVELIGRTIPLDDFAAAAGTIGYEVLTRIGSRAEKVYVGG